MDIKTRPCQFKIFFKQLHQNRSKNIIEICTTTNILHQDYFRTTRIIIRKYKINIVGWKLYKSFNIFRPQIVAQVCSHKHRMHTYTKLQPNGDCYDTRALAPSPALGLDGRSDFPGGALHTPDECPSPDCVLGIRGLDCVIGVDCAFHAPCHDRAHVTLSADLLRRTWGSKTIKFEYQSTTTSMKAIKHQHWPENIETECCVKLNKERNHSTLSYVQHIWFRTTAWLHKSWDWHSSKVVQQQQKLTVFIQFKQYCILLWTIWFLLDAM